MLAATLQRLIDQKLTTARELGELAGVSASTVYRWINGESQPDFDAVRLMLAHLKNPKAQMQLLATFTAGTAWQAQLRDHDLDLNADGRIDAQDAIDACIRVVSNAVESLTYLRRDLAQDATPTPQQCVQTIALLEEASLHCNITSRVVVKLSQHRKKAHPSF